jgi:hypothetical protein
MKAACGLRQIGSENGAGKGHLKALRLNENPSQDFTFLKERFSFRLWTDADRQP